MRNILLTISYDGTDFCGWQRQDKSNGGKPVRTVQGEVERALEKIHKTHIALQGSGRTDSGVHAIGQAANFFSPIDTIPIQNYPRALNSFLAQDVRIISASLVSKDFNARHSATSRTYRYFIKNGSAPYANQTRYCWYINYMPNIARLNEMASLLNGELDFKTFTASGDKSTSTFRYVEKARFFEIENSFGEKMLVFEIEANAFLWKMVRSLTGTLIEFDRANKTANDFKDVLFSCNRKNAGPTAPPHGLFLWKVSFCKT